MVRRSPVTICIAKKIPDKNPKFHKKDILYGCLYCTRKFEYIL